jgi:hypothetical protein
MAEAKSLVGIRYDRLIVLERVFKEKIEGKQNKIHWLCQCDCGKIVTVTGSNLNSNHTRSCGCITEENRPLYRKTHGLIHLPEYSVWAKIKERCYSPKVKSYKYYGGKGVIVCQRWLDSFEQFYADMGSRPSPQHSIERDDVNGNYEPNNCRWATAQEQARNRTSSVKLDYCGKQVLLIELGEKYNIPYNTLYRRIFIAKWSVEKSLTTPIKKKIK